MYSSQGHVPSVPLLQIAVKLVAMFGDSIRNASLPVKELFLHHLLQLRCNTLAVSSLSGRFLSTEQQSGSNVQDKYEVKLGSALYPTLSLINHSCRPNAILRLCVHCKTNSIYTYNLIFKASFPCVCDKLNTYIFLFYDIPRICISTLCIYVSTLCMYHCTNVYTCSDLWVTEPPCVQPG